MTNNQKSLLIGMCLGDGYIYCNKLKGKKYCGLSLKHDSKQKEYIKYKADLINSICGGKRKSVIPIDNNGYLGYTYSKGHKYFRCIHNWLYTNNKKIISPYIMDKLNIQALSFWWMDDGCLFPKKRNGKIHAWELYLNLYVDFSQATIIQQKFLEKWGIEWKLNSDRVKFKLRCSTREGRKFLNLVRPYVLPIKCMNYKAIEI